MTLPLHPRHGTHDPRAWVPELRPGAMRRTTTIDMIRPDGLEGPLGLLGRGREITATGVVRAVTRLEVTLDSSGGREILTIAADPDVTGLETLVGATTGSGFRAKLGPLELDRTSMLHQLLDDLPTASLVSGVATQAAGPPLPRSFEPMFLAMADQCAGWATGATILLDVAAHGSPGMPTGPLRPDGADADDPGELPPHGVRRQRRTDAWTEDGVVQVRSWFRDSHMSGEGQPTVIHEYDVEVTAEPGTGLITGAVATARTLPWLECPSAAGSASWLVGLRFQDLRSDVRKLFTGIATCTHLNDQLRSLADVPALL